MMLRTALAENPTLAQVSKNLGDLLYRAGRYDDAFEAYERAAKLSPDLGDDLYFKMGNIAFKRRDRERARVLLEAGDRAESRPSAGPGQPRYPGRDRMTAAEDPGFVALAERIAGRSGLDVGAYKDRCLRRRIAARMRACGVHTYADYVEVLDARPEELDRLLDALTINVTKFFRNPETWAWLGDHLLPGAARGPRGRRCACGAPAARLARSPTRWRCWSADVLERLDRHGLAAPAAGSTPPTSIASHLPGPRPGATTSGPSAKPNRRLRGTVLPAARGSAGSRYCPELRSLVTVRRLDLTARSRRRRRDTISSAAATWSSTSTGRPRNG